VVLAIAQDTYFGAASATAGIFPSGCQINANFTRFDPIPAALGGTIQILGRRVLFELLVPESLELIVEQTIDMLQWDMLLSAAARWHVGRIFHRESELSLQTCVTHTMAAGELCCFGDGNIVVHTDKTIDPDISLIWWYISRQRLVVPLHFPDRRRARSCSEKRCKDTPGAPARRLLSGRVRPCNRGCGGDSGQFDNTWASGWSHGQISAARLSCGDTPDAGEYDIPI
jgi:hypothetical protein